MWKRLWQQSMKHWSVWKRKPTLSSQTFKSGKMLSVRSVEGEERLQIWLKMELENGRERTYNFDRLKSEDLQTTFTRMANNLSKNTNKRNKKRFKKGQKVEEASASANNGEEETNVNKPLISLNILHKGGKVDETTSNEKAWVEGAVFEVGEKRFDVCVNLPHVRTLSLPESIMAGAVVYPKIVAEFIDYDQTPFIWYREKKAPTQASEGDKSESQEQGTLKKKPKHDPNMNVEWEELHTGFYYVARDDDIGRRLRLVCKPKAGDKKGDEKEAVTKCEVTRGPGLCPFENRHQFTKKRAAEGRFRVMTYNILADFYADSDFTRNFLFPYCPPHALALDYRKQLLIKEILGYNSDIICLQEVDKKVFMYHLMPLLEREGFEGFMKLKTGQVAEGCATFFRKSHFKFVKQHDLDMVEALQGEDLYKDLLERVNSNETFKEKVMTRTTTVQMTMLESIEPPHKKLAVVTTHLFFHPRAPHVRVVQTAICLRHIERVLKEYSQDSPIAVIYSGDFNSYPEGGVHQLLREKRIPANHADWYAGGRTEFVENMELTHSLNLTSAAGYPRYTNFVGGFTGCLDYIYINEELRTDRIIPMPTHEEVTRHTALPNIVFPSDHLAVVCDVAWTDTAAMDVS